MIDEVAARIWRRAEFQADYVRLLRCSLQEYVRIREGVEQVEEDALVRLLQSAAHFAASSDVQKREAAYRIASSSWILFGDVYGVQLRELVHVVLGRLGNFPAVSFLFRSALEDRGSLLSTPIWFEIGAREIANEVQVVPDRTLTLTDFQRRLWEVLATGASATVTAPTSAGKSYALQNFLVGRLANEPSFSGLYIVPTRALIHQVSASLLALSRSFGVRDLPVLTVPIPRDAEEFSRGLYVLTQERVQILMERDPSVAFPLVVVDEAQTIASDSRGVILQTMIDQLVLNRPDTQFLFSSPNVSNPQVFQHLFNLQDVGQVDEYETPVAQNLIFLTTDVDRRASVEVGASVQGKREDLGTVVVDVELFNEKQKLSYLTWWFGREDQNLVYAGSPASCEDVAGQISQLTEGTLRLRPKGVRAELEELSTFLREHVHPRYLLADCVRVGVGFHYGQMPSIVRSAMEDYFDQGLLRYLVCTSTLLHGVNLPAKNLFLLDPTKGGEWPTPGADAITSAEFWNLAGRAGRLGREFEGNIFIIDQSRWRSSPVDDDRRQEITSALDDQLTSKRDTLLYFIRDREHASGRQQGAETAFVRLFNQYRRGKLDGILSRVCGDDEGAAAKLRLAIANAASAVSIPPEITEQHITVSVYRQQEMYDYLVARIRSKGPREYLPPHPLADWNDAYRRILRLFKRMHTHFERIPKGDNSHKYYAGLALRWMRGDALPWLIADAYKWRRGKSKREPSISTVIRDVMSDIENDLRFRYVRYTRCCLDLLRRALRQTGNGEYVESVPNLPLYLELGACSGTMVSCIGLGLSRTTAQIISEKTVDKSMDLGEVRSWLAGRDLEALGVPNVCIREIHRLAK